MHGDREHIFLNLLELKDLFRAYMPFIKGGGIFVTTHHYYRLSDPVTLQINLLNESQSYASEGKVVWIMPKSAQSGYAAGIGIQLLGNSGSTLRTKIEVLLAAHVKQ